MLIAFGTQPISWSLMSRDHQGTTVPQPSAHIGTSPPSREHSALVTGRGTYTDDVPLDDALHIFFVRSPVASGAVNRLDVKDASQIEGVVHIHTGADVDNLGDLSVNPVIDIDWLPDFPVLASGHLRAVGQPVAAVLADTPAAAQDGAEAVWIDYSETPQKAKQVAHDSWTNGDMAQALSEAAHVVQCRIEHPRLAPSPLEPRSIAVAYDLNTQCVAVWLSTQTPHRARQELASILGVNVNRIRVIAPDVGGAFGMKASVYPEEVFAVWAAFHHRRNVKWTSSRSEEFLSATHGRGVTSQGTLAIDAAGHILGMSAHIEAPIGAWVPNSGLIPAWNAARVLPSGYNVPALEVTTKAIQSNHAPTGIYRGAGRPEANCLMERLIDKAARILAMDPIEFRQLNLLRADDLPHATSTGNLLDSGDYYRTLDLLNADGEYRRLITERDHRRKNGELAGLGVAFYVEPSGEGWESASVTLDEDGNVHVASGSSSQGHGRETAFAQIAAAALNVPLDRIQVTFGDTDHAPNGIGALASRSTAIGGSAVLDACNRVSARLSTGKRPPLTEFSRYENTGSAWGYGAYLTLISIDRDTGALSLEHIMAVDDTGIVLNPEQVKGQILGGIAQGIGEALIEHVEYDSDGQLLTGSFMDYAMPRAADMAPTVLKNFQTPSPTNILGAKGVGEAGTIGAPAAILNAAIDALSPLGVTDLNMPLTSETIWRAIRAAEQETDQ